MRRPLSVILLDFLESKAANQPNLSLGEILGKLQQRGFGVVLFLCALVCMTPMPGPNAILAIPLFIIAPQMVLNKRRLWLPVWVLRRQAPTPKILHYYQKILPALQFLEKITKARLAYIVPRRQLTLVGLIVLITALAIALPLPVPGSNTIPSGALVMMGLGMFMRDGLLVLLGGLVATLASVSLFGLIVFVYGLVV